MLDMLWYKYHTCIIDNMFVSDKFFWGFYVDIQAKVIVYGVLCTDGKSLPPSILQVDYTKDKKIYHYAWRY